MTPRIPGMSSEARFETSSAGIRGDEFANGQEYRILAIGGSTTENLYLDQGKAWPYLLQEKLTKKIGRNVWVGNVGKSGINTRHHIRQMEYQLPQYPNIDAVVLLIGINDLQLRLSQDDRYTPEYSPQALLPQVFSIYPLEDSKSVLERTELWQSVRKLIPSYKQTADVRRRIFEDRRGEWVATWRRYRRDATKIRDALPDLSTALDEYSGNIEAIFDLGKRRGTRVILLTQPVLWNAGLSTEFRDLLWMGGVGDFQSMIGHEYYSVEALAKAMSMYNETLIKTARKKGIEFFDLAARLPNDTTVFYDDCHFNESGSSKIAEILSEHLASLSLKREDGFLRH